MDEATTVNAIDGTPSASCGTEDLPLPLPLEFVVQDADTISELVSYPEGEERERFALDALRIGVLALRQARGQWNADQVRHESDRLLDLLRNRLDDHSNQVHDRLTGILKEYFDPEGGRLEERVNRLVKQDGDLEQLLRRQIGVEDSELCKTLTSHFGEESPLMKILSPDQSKGLLAELRETLADQLRIQREHVLDQFSLDNKEGALSRFISELTDHNGELNDQLRSKIDGLVKEFSLNEEGSALNRLVKNVQTAQETITKEFSLDEEKSALARLKRELLTLLEKERETNQKFQEEVKTALQAMVTRRKEADRSTTHGLEFEDAVYEFIQRESQSMGDIPTHTGNRTGLIKNCKVGDCVIELGPESAAPGAQIAVEVKEKGGYTVAEAREEIETARKNRNAQIGLFVFSKRSAPSGIEALFRLGHDVFVVWDAQDALTDLYLRVGGILSRALCVRNRETAQEQTADFTEIDKAIHEIEKRAGNLDDIQTWATTIQNNSKKILDKTRLIRDALEKQVEILRGKTDSLKAVLESDENYVNNG
jgi:hypothetical protein